jgi:hypothetical protein
MIASEVRVDSDWLDLREPADAAARSRELGERLRGQPPPNGRWLIHDLGSGTGAMGRWLAPLLAGAQHWVLHDRDGELLDRALVDPPRGAAISVEARESDVTRLYRSDLAGASLITASALLDMLTTEELARLTAACAGAGCPVLLTLSVVGRVALTPADPLDGRIAAAFNAHQRRPTNRGRLLGPDALARAVQAFGELGAEVLVRASPWRLGASDSGLVAAWLTGWVGAACEEEVQLTAEAEAYASRRLAQAAAGELAVTVQHADLLALPR